MQDLQNMKDRIESQMRQLQQAQAQQQQPQMPTNLTQNFQLAPQNNNELEGKYAENIEQVRNTFVVKPCVFLTKNYETVWIKEVSGNIRTFKTEEIVEMNPKDKEIYELKKQIEEMRGIINDTVEHDNSNFDESVEIEKAKRVSNNKRTNTK
jgi:hypothetical protein